MSALSIGDGFHPVHALPVRRKASLAAEVVGAYLRTRRLIAADGLPHALADARSTGVGSSGLTPAERTYVAYRLARIVERILRFLPDARCLTRSVVLVRLLAKRDIAALLVIGVSPAPAFEAHAWVEIDGTAVLPAHEEKYSRLVEL